jgi:DNA-binding MarR family transcriptional regulator
MFALESHFLKSKTKSHGRRKPTSHARVQLPLESSFGHLIRSIHRLQAQLLRARLAEDGVSLGCWYFLRVLWNEDMITQRELSLRTRVNQATTRTAVDRMEAERLVNRMNDPKDRRKRFIRLTERAKELEPSLISFADRLNNQILEILPKDKQKELLVHLRKIHDHIQSLAANESGFDKLD